MKRILSIPSSTLCLVAAAVILVAAVTALDRPTHVAAQQEPTHLNPVIAKWVAGKPVIGTHVREFSMSDCQSYSRLDLDFVYLDMEHGVFDIKDMDECAAFMVDKEEAIKKGNASVNVALFARFPPYGRDMDGNEWIAKQALDHGLMGVIFNGTDNAQQARHEVQFMRYPQARDSKYPLPAGTRGEGAEEGIRVWGVSSAEYAKHADLWPLNPDGDLLCIPMIETAEGLKNVDAIASVPGVGALFVGQGGDLHEYLGLPSAKSPELEAAFAKILAACKAHHIACGISANTNADINKRLKEGWMFIRATNDTRLEDFGYSQAK